MPTVAATTTPPTNTVDNGTTGGTESPVAPVAPVVALVVVVCRDAEVDEIPPERTVALPGLHEISDPEATATAVSTASLPTVSPTAGLGPGAPGACLRVGSR